MKHIQMLGHEISSDQKLFAKATVGFLPTILETHSFVHGCISPTKNFFI